jgi:RecB family endonuclease NucS
MFQVDRSKNGLKKLEEKRFSDLNLREREHLQEWVANQPDALGEELLIIQKEFNGFADTRERLDLLALDKDGQIEPKVEDFR